jgi:hypothetical protein
MTSTIDAPAVPEGGAVCPPGPLPTGPLPTGPLPTRAAQRVESRHVVVRRLPRQYPISGPPEPEPAADPPSAEPCASGMAVAFIEVRTVLQLTLETLDGRRPRSQLGGRLSTEVLRYLAAATGRLNPPGDRRANALRGRHGPPGLHSVRVSHPADGVTEASAVWRHRGRVRALAARFEWTGTRWTCTALRLG